jgi:hypothetical protein
MTAEAINSLFDLPDSEPEEPSFAPETERLPARSYGGLVPSWDARLPFELALGVYSLDEILDRHGLTHHQLDLLYDHPVFHKQALDARKEVAEHGLTFRAKSRLQAEEYLRVLDTLVMDPEVSASVRLDAIKSVVKWGDLEPDKKAAGSDDAGANQVAIQINIGNDQIKLGQGA